MPFSPQDKCQVIEQPTALPAQCVVCNAHGDGQRKFLDFGLQVDWYGQVLICTICLDYMARGMDYVKSDEQRAALIARDAANRQRDSILEELQRVKNVLGDHLRHSADTSNAPDNVGAVSSGEGIPEDSVADANSAERPIDDSDESSRSKGSNRIRKSAKSDTADFESIVF